MNPPEHLGAQYDDLYNSLPQDRFPALIRLAPYMVNTEWQEEFDFGLNVLLDGLPGKLPS